MVVDTPKVDLDALRAALQRLNDPALPEEVRKTSAQALQTLEDFAQRLTASEEQTRLAALYRVSQSLGTSLNLREVLNQVMDAVIELTGAERGFLMLLDPDRGGLDLRAARNFERETLDRKDMEVSRTVIEATIESGEGVLTTNAQEDPRFSGQESVVMFNLRSIMCAPLRSMDRVIGVIYVDNRVHSGIFTDKDLELLNAFAGQAAVAIENARLYTRTDQKLAERVGELETLTQIDRQLSASLEFDHVMQVTRRWAIEGAGAKEGWIALTGEDGATLTVVTEPNVGRVIAPSEPLVARALAQLIPVAFPPDQHNVAHAVAPILQADRPIGVLAVIGENAFSESALEFLARLAARAAIAIQDARLYQAVQHANLAKSKFVSVVSHELRIPMTSIQGYTDLLLKGSAGPVTEQQIGFLQVIRNNVGRMGALVSDLSDISRIETGRLKLEPALLDLKTYLDQTLASLRPKLQEKNQTLELYAPDDLPQVYTDPNRVMQVLTNLISNAWKYTPEGGWITVVASAVDDQVRVEVRDTGIGISPEDQANLFTQFFRSEDPMVREEQGWGLGLNVTKRLVELLGGEIGVKSALSKGSTFWFTLPVGKAAQYAPEAS